MQLNVCEMCVTCYEQTKLHISCKIIQEVQLQTQNNSLPKSFGQLHVNFPSFHNSIAITSWHIFRFEAVALMGQVYIRWKSSEVWQPIEKRCVCVCRRKSQFLRAIYPVFIRQRVLIWQAGIWRSVEEIVDIFSFCHRLLIATGNVEGPKSLKSSANEYCHETILL